MAFDSWGLLNAARGLVADEAASNSHCARAISTAYYAIFQHICSSSADLLIGGSDKELTRAKSHMMRSIGHKALMKRLESAQNASIGFHESLIGFANSFCILQVTRTHADYDATKPFSRADALTAILNATMWMSAYDQVPEKHRKAFVVWAILDKPRR